MTRRELARLNDLLAKFYEEEAEYGDLNTISEIRHAVEEVHDRKVNA